MIGYVYKKQKSNKRIAPGIKKSKPKYKAVYREYRFFERVLPMIGISPFSSLVMVTLNGYKDCSGLSGCFIIDSTQCTIISAPSKRYGTLSHDHVPTSFEYKESYDLDTGGYTHSYTLPSQLFLDFVDFIDTHDGGQKEFHEERIGTRLGRIGDLIDYNDRDHENETILSLFVRQ